MSILHKDDVVIVRVSSHMNKLDQHRVVCTGSKSFQIHVTCDGI